MSKSSPKRKVGARSEAFNVAVVAAAGVIMVTTLSGNAEVNEPRLAIATETSLYCDSDSCLNVTN